MRFVTFAPAALGALVSAAIVAGAALPAAAQDSSTRIIIRKQPERSYLDPGTMVKPGTSRDLNYVDATVSRYPQYGDDSTITGIRYPLPDKYYLPSR